MKRIFGIAVLLGATQAASAADIDRLQDLAQGEFRKFSEDLGGALGYKALAPIEPLGILGIDVGVEVTATSLENKDLYDVATGGNGLDTLVVPKLHAHKGLPFGIDVGAFLSSVPDSNIKLAGVEVSYAILEGGIAVPAVGVRATYSKLSGVDQLAFDTKGLELGISKGFAMLTPYGGIGQQWVTSTPISSTGLKEETFSQKKVFVGANFNMGLINLAVEGDRTGENTTYGLKLGFRF